MTLFLSVIPCSLADRYQCVRQTHIFRVEDGESRFLKNAYTSLAKYTTPHHIPQDSNVQSHCHENLRYTLLVGSLLKEKIKLTSEQASKNSSSLVNKTLHSLHIILDRIVI